jgi:hypothetical protein
VAYRRNGEPVSPPEWWSKRLTFEHVSDTILVEDIKIAYGAGRRYYMDLRRVKVKNSPHLLI